MDSLELGRDWPRMSSPVLRKSHPDEDVTEIDP